MSNPFFDHPILNSPYQPPARHWELDDDGQPTQRILEQRRSAKFITPIPKPKKRRTSATQSGFVFDEGEGLSSQKQQYDATSNINEVRGNVDAWRALPNPSQWQVTPETARLLQHWRHHDFSGVRPFFCQVEAVETAIWLTEVAPQSKSGRRLLEYLASANNDANPQLVRFALKLVTGAGKSTLMAMLIAWQTINAVRRPRSNEKCCAATRSAVGGASGSASQAGFAVSLGAAFARSDVQPRVVSIISTIIPLHRRQCTVRTPR